MIIGHFTAGEDGSYTGEIVTLGTRQAVTFKPAERGADYLVTIAGYEVGAAWKRTSRESKPYLSVKLDTPFLPAAINAALILQKDGSHALIWSRERADAAAAAA